MYKKILIATDGSPASKHALDHGVALAKAVGASVLLVNVTDIWSALDIAKAAEGGVSKPVEQYEALAAKSARITLDAAAAAAKNVGIACEVLHVEDQAPAEGIIATAKKNGCDLIVMGTHGRRGINRLMLGSQATKVVTLSEIPVLVVR